MILLAAALLPLSAEAKPFGVFSMAMDGGFTSADSIPAWTYGGGFSFRMGGDIDPQLGFYGSAEAGIAVPFRQLHRFLELPSSFLYGIGAGVEYRAGRWTLMAEAGIRSFLVSGQQELMYGGSFTISYALMTGEELGLGTRREPLPIAYMLSLPVSAYFSPDGISLSIGIAVTMEVSEWFGGDYT